MADLKKCLCIDVGGTAIKYGLIDSEVNLTDKGEVPTPYDGVEAYLDVLERLYRGVEDKVQGIAMSVPGVIDSENGICVSGGNLRFIENFNLAGELGRRVKVPVTVMNDAKSAAMAEARWGALADCRDGVVIVLGTGIGGALIKDGRVHFGKNFAAGMSGGIAYVLDENSDLYLKLNKELVSSEAVSNKYDVMQLKDMITAHVEATGSEKGKEILENFKEILPKFKKIIPHDYKNMLQKIAIMEEKGLSNEQAQIEAFYETQKEIS